MFLATTADTRFWDVTKKIMFLGEWCKTYGNKDLWNNSNNITSEYHWNDKIKFDKDYDYLDRVYETYLLAFSKQLNVIHNTNFSNNYWRIIIGVWLKGFIDTVFDRFESLEKVKKTNLVKKTWICDTSIWQPYTPINSFHDNYNLYLISCILEITKMIPFEKKPINVFSSNEVNYYKQKASFLGIFSFFRHFKKKPNIFLRQSIAVLKSRVLPAFLYNFKNKIIVGGEIYLSTKMFIILQIKLKMFLPTFHGKRIILDKKYSIPLRNKIEFTFKDDQFHKVLNKLLPNLIPSIYVEYYKKFSEVSLKNSPQKTDYTIHCSSMNYQFSYQFWMAYHVEINKMKVLTSQHGGGYGSMKKCFLDTHNAHITYIHLTWGSRFKKNSNIKPFPSLRLTQSKINIKKNNTKGLIMWVQTSYPRYKNYAESSYSGPEMLNYFKDQELFYKSINSKIRNLLIWRKYSDLWDDEKRMKEFAPNLKIQRVQKNQLGKVSNFDNEIQNCRLSIHTANETTYLQTLSANFPTLVFWDKNICQVHDYQKEIFEELVNVGILHYCPKNCAKKLNEIYDDPLKWWNQKNVQKSRKFFCDRLAKTENIYFDEWKKLIDKL